MKLRAEYYKNGIVLCIHVAFLSVNRIFQTARCHSGVVLFYIGGSSSRQCRVLSLIIFFWQLASLS